MEWWMILLIIAGGLAVLPFVIQGLIALVLIVVSALAGVAYAIYSGARKIFSR